MHRILKREQILTIPNLLSLVRLAMIPLIVWLYCVKQEYKWTVVIIVMSGVTDILDGYIARKYHMTSDFGKILDPIADKLTQAALIICLLEHYYWMRWLLVLFAAKEIIMGISGLVVIKKKDVVNSSQWFGKLATVVLYGVMILLFLFPGLPEALANTMIALCALLIMMSLLKYLLFYKSLFSRQKDEPQ